MDDNAEICERYRCPHKAVGRSKYGELTCYYHESKEDYLARMREMGNPPIPSNVSPNDPTWRNPMSDPNAVWILGEEGQC